MIRSTHAIVLDDHQLFADSFSELLDKYLPFEQIHSFTKSDQLIDFLIAYGRKKIHIFLDYYLADKNGLSLLPDIKRLNKDAYIIFVTSLTSVSAVQNMILAKPHAILSKFCDLPTVVQAIKQVERSVPFLDEYFDKLLKGHGELALSFTPRELELLRYFAEGISIAETAARVSLSRHTIVSHRRKMMAKANCHSIGQLVKLAQDQELI